MSMTLYTTGCPQCKVLETLMNNKSLHYNKITNEEEMIAKGIMSAPMLEIDGELLNYPQAMKYVKEI